MNTDVVPGRSEVVVIGGGVMGAAALHYLVELGCEQPSTATLVGGAVVLGAVLLEARTQPASAQPAA